MNVRSGVVAGVITMVMATSAVQAQTQPPKLAATPPMGWNSWDSYGLTITEPQFRDNVTVLARQFKKFGWNYAVIDEGWFFYNPQDRPHPDTLHYALDRFGRYVPVPARFPSTLAKGSKPGDSSAPLEPGMKLPVTIENTSFQALSDWVHSQGLKFGIHIVRGIPRAAVERNLPIEVSAFKAQDAADQTDVCPWDPTNWGVKDNPAGQAWYDSVVRQYAGWGVDLLKVDCIAQNPYKADEIRMIRRAIDKTGRPIVLSLSPGPTSLDHASEVSTLANMWRISDDVWDLWANTTGKPFPQSLASQFGRTAAWAQYAGPGHWPDADMLPIGELKPMPGYGHARTSRLTPTEQQTMLTLWSMARSPLILGANLTLLDDATAALLTNPDLLRIDQTALASREALHEGNVIAWTADLPPGTPGGYTTALALFNVGDEIVTLDSSFEAYGLPAQTYLAKDVWSGRVLGPKKSVESLSLEPHASALWLLRR